MNSFRVLFKYLYSPWFIALLLLGVFLSTTSYKYGWDDQHVEIPLLKSLIDSSLYVGDYYVESLKKNFPSYLYPILAHFININQIPGIYFILYLVSRYFLFFWMYKLWLSITKDKLHAFSCMIVFIAFSRVYEFLYRTFSHQEFALAIIFAGIYFFFIDRFFIAAILLGIATDFHALYSLFPFIYMEIYLLWQIKRYGIISVVKVLFLYLFFASPFIFWIVGNHMAAKNISAGISHTDWKSLYLLACPQNFMLPPVSLKIIVSSFKLFFAATKNYLVLLFLFIINVIFNNAFKHNRKALAVCIGAFFLLIVCFVFTYIYPIKFVVDLNLIRNTQYLHFFLMGFTTILFIKIIEKEPIVIGFAMSAIFSMLKYSEYIKLISLSLLFFTLIALNVKKIKIKWLTVLMIIVLSFFVLCSVCGLYLLFKQQLYQPSTYVCLIILTVGIIVVYIVANCVDTKKREIIKKMFYIVPLTISLLQFIHYNIERQHKEKYGDGFWRVRRSWVDMQRFVKENTPKDAIILVPYDLPMGGFRIFSERKIVASERDCGIVGFDYNAALEWKKRIDDISAYTIRPKRPIIGAIKNAILKYHANYVVFLRYIVPSGNNHLFKRIYTNSDFALFKVMKL